MKFLAVLITLFFYRNWQGGNPIRERLPFAAYYDWFAEKNLPTYWRYALCVVVPVVLMLWLSAEVSHWWQGVIWLALSLVVLVYSVDLLDLEARVEEQVGWLRAISDEDQMADVVQQQDDFQLAFLYDLFQSIVPGLFWFLIAGPAGTLLYVLNNQYLQRLDDDDPEVNLLENIEYWMEWVPARITGLLFALVGNFGPTFDYWLNHVSDTEEAHALHLSVLAAIAAEKPADHDDSVTGFARFSEFQVHQLKALSERALFGWLGVAAVIVILGW